MRSIKATLLSNANATGAAVEYPGGKTIMHVMGTLATTNTLQVIGPDGSTWLDVATVAAAGVTDLDLVHGQYRFSLAGGTPAGVYVDLIRVPY